MSNNESWVAQNGETRPVEEDNDPYSPQNIGTIQFILQARIYDVLMAVLKELNSDAADNLLELHHTGAVAGASPYFNGQFITDILNSEGVKE